MHYHFYTDLWMNIIHQLHHIILTIKKVAKDFFSFLFEREREREREILWGNCPKYFACMEVWHCLSLVDFYRRNSLVFLGELDTGLKKRSSKRKLKHVEGKTMVLAEFIYQCLCLIRFSLEKWSWRHGQINK